MTAEQLQTDTVGSNIIDFKERSGNLYLTVETPAGGEAIPIQSVFIITGAGAADVTKE